MDQLAFLKSIDKWPGEKPFSYCCLCRGDNALDKEYAFVLAIDDMFYTENSKIVVFLGSVFEAQFDHYEPDQCVFFESPEAILAAGWEVD